MSSKLHMPLDVATTLTLARQIRDGTTTKKDAINILNHLPSSRPKNPSPPPPPKPQEPQAPCTQ